METTLDGNGQPDAIFDFQRVRAALALRGRSVEYVARSADRTQSHLWQILHNRRRPSIEVLDKIREVLGPSGFDFATGKVDVLRVDPPAAAVQP